MKTSSLFLPILAAAFLFGPSARGAGGETLMKKHKAKLEIWTAKEGAKYLLPAAAADLVKADIARVLGLEKAEFEQSKLKLFARQPSGIAIFGGVITGLYTDKAQNAIFFMIDDQDAKFTSPAKDMTLAGRFIGAGGVEKFLTIHDDGEDNFTARLALSPCTGIFYPTRSTFNAAMDCPGEKDLMVNQASLFERLTVRGEKFDNLVK